ncbi:MAG: flagellar basal body rod protein FlgC [Thermoguttaceae bacterium]
MFAALDISTSGLVAQRVRMNAISSNIANMSTTHNEQGERVPYQPKYTVFQTDDEIGAHGAPGVRVSSIETSNVEPLLRWDPGNPESIQEGPNKGYVAYPNVNMMVEFVDAMEAARAYEANLGVMDITKNLTQQTLRILA